MRIDSKKCCYLAYEGSHLGMMGAVVFVGFTEYLVHTFI